MNVFCRSAIAVLFILPSIIHEDACVAAENLDIENPLTTWERAFEKYQIAGRFIANEEWESALQCLRDVGRAFPPPYATRALLIADQLDWAVSHDQEQAKKQRLCMLAMICVPLESYSGAVKYYKAALQVDGKLSGSDATALLNSMQELNMSVKDFEILAKEYPLPIFRERAKQLQRSLDQPHSLDDKRWEPVDAIIRAASLTNLKQLKDAAAESNLAGRQADAYQHIASGLRERGDLVGAEAWEKKLCEEIPEALEHIARIYYWRGNAEQADGKGVEAASCFRKAAETFPKSRVSDNAKIMLAITLDKQGKQLEAVQECLELLDEPMVADVELVNVRDKEFVEVEKGMRHREYLHQAATLVSKIKEKQGNLPDALKFARLAHEEFPLRSFCETCRAQSEAAIRNRVAELRKKIHDDRIKEIK